METKSLRELVEELAGNVCRCGQTKMVRQTFCFGCYIRLPRNQRDPLYQRMGQGYEEAYSVAVDYLRRRHERRTNWI